MASDYITEHGYMVKDACTSLPCTWNKGKKRQKELKALHKVNYPSSKRLAADSLYNWDPRPPPPPPPPQNYVNVIQIYVISLYWTYRKFPLNLGKYQCGKHH